MLRKYWQLLLLGLFVLLVVPVIAGTFEVQSTVIGRRLDDQCAEHDTFLAYALQKTAGQTLAPGWMADYEFDLIATHPLSETAANGLLPENWCDANSSGCPDQRMSNPVRAISDTLTKIYDDGTWVVKTLDAPGFPVSMTISLNGSDHGEHNGLVFNRRRTDQAGAWPEYMVVYANGFLRLKPMGESDADIDDPCYGTSAVLGPFQFTTPLLADEPHPELHPLLDQVDIALSGPSGRPGLSLGGRFVDSGATTLISATWSISTTAVNTQETRLAVRQVITGVETVTLQSLGEGGVLGVSSLSSMWADADTHDADVLQIVDSTGQVTQTAAGAISGSPFGETAPLDLSPPYTVSLVTRSATDHNVGAPDVHIYLKQAQLNPTYPLSAATILGPIVGYTDTSYVFSAAISPTYATQPVTYTWSPPPLSGQGSLTATYGWEMPGLYTLTVVAENCCSRVTDTHRVTISAAVPLTGLTIVGPEQMILNTPDTFTATTTPLSATLPISYTWMPPPAAGQGTATAAYSWPSTGTHTITVTATNQAAALVDTHTIMVVKASPLPVTKQASARCVTTGETLTFTIRITNTTPVDQFATVTDTSYQTGTTSLPQVWPLTVPGGEALELQYSVRFTDPFTGSIRNHVLVNTQQGATGEARVTVYVNACPVYLPLIKR